MSRQIQTMFVNARKNRRKTLDHIYQAALSLSPEESSPSLKMLSILTYSACFPWGKWFSSVRQMAIYRNLKQSFSLFWHTRVVHSGIVQTHSWKFIGSLIPSKRCLLFINRQLFTWTQFDFFYRLFTGLTVKLIYTKTGFVIGTPTPPQRKKKPFHSFKPQCNIIHTFQHVHVTLKKN